MKTLLITLMSLLPLIGFSQVRGIMSDQNPNHQKAYEQYATNEDDETNQLSTTVQNTYEAVDEWQEKKDWKEYKKRERFEAKMEQKRNRTYYRPYRSYRNYYSPYGGNYNRRFGLNPYFFID